VKVSTYRRGLRRVPRYLSTSYVSKVALRVLRDEKWTGRGELHVIFVDGKEIKKLNQALFGKRRGTDVIALPYYKKSFPSRDALMGEIYISTKDAAANARAYGQSFKRELTRLVVHGVLHLLGYTDKRPREKARMWKRQERFVDRFCPQKS